MRRRIAAATTSLVLLGTALAAQTPARPRLAPDADTNDPRAYVDLAVRIIRRDARRAAAAFFWAERLDPVSAFPPYGRHAALLLTRRSHLYAYVQNDPAALREPDVRTADSLFRHALMLDPFVHRGLELTLLLEAARAGLWRQDLIPASRTRDVGILLGLGQYFETYDLYRRGLMEYSESQFGAALRYWDQALRREGESRAALIHAERAQVFFLLGMLDSAAAAMDSALRDSADAHRGSVALSPRGWAHWLVMRGTIADSAGDRARARATFQAALTADLSYYPAHVRLGLLALSAGDTAEALMELERAAAVRDDAYLPRYTLGALLGRLGRRADALGHLRAAAAREPWAPGPWLHIGVINDEAADTAEAVAAFIAFVARARREDPNLEPVRRRLTLLRGPSPR